MAHVTIGYLLVARSAGAEYTSGPYHTDPTRVYAVRHYRIGILPSA